MGSAGELICRRELAKTDDGFVPGQHHARIIDPHPHRDRADLAAILTYVDDEGRACSVECMRYRDLVGALVARGVEDMLEDVVLANDPEIRQSLAEADEGLKQGRTMSLSEFLKRQGVTREELKRLPDAEVADVIVEVADECKRAPGTHPLRSLVDRLFEGEPPEDVENAMLGLEPLGEAALRGRLEDLKGRLAEQIQKGYDARNSRGRAVERLERLADAVRDHLRAEYDTGVEEAVETLDETGSAHKLASVLLAVEEEDEADSAIVFKFADQPETSTTVDAERPERRASAAWAWVCDRFLGGQF